MILKKKKIATGKKPIVKEKVVFQPLPTVDGRNPAPRGMVKALSRMGWL